ncbi:MAG: sigma-70 family RNA polymerase sigma factor [Gemmatimonadota bacterium]
MRTGFAEEALVHLDAVYGLALRLTGGDEFRSKELAREAVLEAYRHRSAGAAGTDVRAWLMTIVRDAFLDEVRRRSEPPRPAEQDGSSGWTSERAAPVFDEVEDRDPEGDFFERISDAALAEAIESLPGELRVPLVLADLEGYSYRAIEEDLGLPLRTVKSRLFEGRRRLLRKLYEHAVERGYVA